MSQAHASYEPIANAIAGETDTLLVTGASGFIGVSVVSTLLAYGYRRIRCFVRPSGNRTRLDNAIREYPDARDSVEIVEGNLLSREDCRHAARGVAVVFHLAAGIDKSFAGCFMNSVLTTRNLLDALLEQGMPRRFVNVSSFAVYSNWTIPRGATIDEEAPLETQPQERYDPYGYAKLKQDKLVQQYHERTGLPYVIVRPGAVFGPGKTSLTGRVGIDTFGVFLHLGGSHRIPFTYVDNCADAIVRAGLVPGIDGQVFNIVDDNLPTSRSFLRQYKRRVGFFTSIPVPYPAAYLLSAAWEKYSVWSQGQLPPRFNRRRANAEWRRHAYSNRRAKELLGWTPRVPFDAAVRRYLESLPARS